MSECFHAVTRHKLTYVDLFQSLMSLPNLAASLSDGLHLARFDCWQGPRVAPTVFTRPGHAVLYQKLSPEFEARLRPDLKFPEWRDLDNEDTAGCYNNWKIANKDRLWWLWFVVRNNKQTCWSMFTVLCTEYCGRYLTPGQLLGSSVGLYLEKVSSPACWLEHSLSGALAWSTSLHHILLLSSYSLQWQGSLLRNLALCCVVLCPPLSEMESNYEYRVLISLPRTMETFLWRVSRNISLWV